MRMVSLVAVIMIISVSALSVVLAAGVVPNPLSSHTFIGTVGKTLNTPANSTLVKSVSDQGIIVELYMQPTIRVGDVVEIHLLVRNVANNANLVPNTGHIVIVDPSGTRIYERGFANTGPATLHLGGAWELAALWDTSTGYNGQSLQPGTYTVQFSVSIVGLAPNTPASSASVTLSQ